MAGRYDYFSYYKPTRPKDAKGGIKAQTKRGAMGKTWWAKKWISVLENLGIGSRLSRGRSYARKGQVLSIEIEKGFVAARVQGTKSKPYNIRMQVATLSKNEWKTLAKDLSSQAIFTARLMAGEMPENIEAAFRESGLSLFPQKSGDLLTGCTCPDWANPCKHTAAVYYLLGEEFDRDPFLIFKLRGIERDELLELIRGSESPSVHKQSSPRKKTKKSRNAFRPLSAEPDKFWGKSVQNSGREISINTSNVHAAGPKQLGNFPFWRGEEHFLRSLEDIYEKAANSGVNVFLGEENREENNPE